MNELRDESNYFLLTGPMGGYQDPRLPGPKNKWDLPWTAECSESSVRRFLGEAKYYLNIYSTVVRHFVGIIDFEKYLEEDSTDPGRSKKQRDSFHAVLYSSRALDILLDSKSDEARAAALPEEDQKIMDSEMDKSVQSVRDLMGKYNLLKFYVFRRTFIEVGVRPCVTLSFQNILNGDSEEKKFLN